MHVALFSKMKKSPLFLNFLIVITVFIFEASGYLLHGSVGYYDGVSLSFKDTLEKNNSIAYGSFNDSLNSIGWGVLNVKSGYGSKIYPDEKIAYAAGYLEGVFTYRRIYQSWINVKKSFLLDDIEKKYRVFYDAQDKWTKEQVDSFAKKDPVWKVIGYIMNQLDGLIDGYNQAARPDHKLDRFAFLFMNGVGDSLDIQHVVDPKNCPDLLQMEPLALRRYLQSHGHCSALVKVTPGFEDLLMAHSTWLYYSMTLRIYKHYDIKFKDPNALGVKMSFSSYPGAIESQDDFYILGSTNMVLLQTTNSIINQTLYKKVTPESLFSWQRVRLANLMADNGRSWTKYFSLYNSGTYNNQYMIIDLKKFEPKKTLHPGTLWVIEQIPGHISSGDMTNILVDGHWPSYNVPFFEDIYNMSGYPALEQKYGPDYSYQLAPRAKIFRRDASAVIDLTKLQHLLRYNDYKHDKYSENDPCNTICCRADLKKQGANAQGCTDTKVTSYQLASSMTSYAINGPTLGTGLPPFTWTPKFKNTSHVGLPTTYNFKFVQMTPPN